MKSKFTFWIAAIATLLSVASSCKKDHSVDKEPEEQNTASKNYLKIGNDYYNLNEAIITYSKLESKAWYRVWLGDSTKGDACMFDFLELPLQDTISLGSFDFKKVNSTSQFEQGKFHRIFLQFGSNPIKTQVTSELNNVKKCNLQIKKHNNTYTFDSEFEYDDKSGKIHYEGEADLFEMSW